MILTTRSSCALVSLLHKSGAYNIGYKFKHCTSRCDTNAAGACSITFNGLIVLDGWRNVVMGKETEDSNDAEDNGYVRATNETGKKSCTDMTVRGPS